MCCVDVFVAVVVWCCVWEIPRFMDGNGDLKCLHFKNVLTCSETNAKGNS